MRISVLISFLLLAFIKINAQEKIEYQLCDQDFRPIYMHDNLPANAMYANTKATAEARALDVIKRLSFEEKLMLTGGWKQMHYPAIPKLGIPPVYFADASQGIHLKSICVKPEKSTSFPSILSLAATWNPSLAYSYAQSLGEECQAWGVNVLLGPGVNMYRNAEGGRNFEYFGEDPLLTSKMSVSYVKGLQSGGTIATIKHFLGNEQEAARHVEDVKIDERTLNEIYLAPYKADLLEGGALAVMTGNNFVNGSPGAANKPLSGDVLRKQYGFKGIIMSDWASSQFWMDKQNLEATSGHSLLMDNNEIFAKYITDEIAAHPEKKAPFEKELEAMVFNNLYTFFKSGVYDRPYRNPALVQKIESHKKIALQSAEEGITLLKNEGNILPLQPDKVKKIVVLGTEAALTMYGGKGSGDVAGYDHVDYMAGLKEIYGDKIMQQKTVNEEEIKAADAVLYFINKPAAEGTDFTYNLPPDIEQNVAKYTALNKNLIVIFSGGNGFDMPWLGRVKGLVFAYLLGQERGHALANVLSGKVSPSGKLPFTIEKSFDDSPAKDYNKLPDGTYFWQGGKPASKKVQDQFGLLPVAYSEGIYMGYRWYEKKKIAPQFPFGYGLSYTTFSFSAIKPSAPRLMAGKDFSISLIVKNTGNRDGAEVAQLYVHDMGTLVDKPVKELKAFQKVFLKAGESKTIQLPLTVDDLAFWNAQTHQWQSNHGQYRIDVGSSSADIKQQVMINY